MENIKVLIFVESRYKVNRKKIILAVESVLRKQDVKGNVEVSIAVVGDRKMRDLSKKYKGEDKTRDILSFALTEGESSYLPSDTLRLGDIVLSYPQVIKQASEDEMMVDDKINQLIEHGLNHLLGLHHE